MRLSLEEVAAIQERRREINRCPLEDIEWFCNGKRIEVTAEDVEEWQFTGMTNIDFAETISAEAEAAEAEEGT